LSLGIAVLKGHVLSLDVTEVTQGLPEGRIPAGALRRERATREHTDPGDLLLRLRVGAHWHDDDAKGKQDEEPTG
jgi:hypothetical protein